MGRPPIFKEGYRELHFKISAREHEALLNLATLEESTISGVARRAIRAYILGSLRFYYVKVGRVYIPPVTEPGFANFDEARKVAAEKGGEVVQRTWAVIDPNEEVE
jgi:hypothetical protein